MIVLIPAYEPGDRLIDLVRELRLAEPGIAVVVVDDGSGPAYASVFEGAAVQGAEVLHHPRNRGKGAALRTGISHALDQHDGSDVVTADADGQHTPADVLAVVQALRTNAEHGVTELILGCRRFSGDVPARSQFGNAVSRVAFRAAAGWSVSDTQTGLRGIPAALLPWMLEVPGDRFEYELEMLVRLRRSGFAAREISIETVYLEHNASSHFRPVLDSLRVMRPLVVFAGSSLLAFAVDTVALLLFTWLSGWLVASIVAARVLSASVNFTVNRRWVFGHDRDRPALGAAVRYAVLALTLLASNIVWMTALTGWGVSLILAKLITEAVLFITSYQVQRHFVFAPKEGHSGPIAAPVRMESATQTLRRIP